MRAERGARLRQQVLETAREKGDRLPLELELPRLVPGEDIARARAE